MKKKVQHYATGWDKAIADAKERIKRLRYTIRVYEARKKAGDTWPEIHNTKLERQLR